MYNSKSGLGLSPEMDQQVCSGEAGPRPSQEAKPESPDQAHGGTRLGTDVAATQLRCSTGWDTAKVYKQLPRERRGRPALLAFFTRALIAKGADLGLSQLNSVTFPVEILEGGCDLGPNSWNAGRFGNNHKTSTSLIYFWETSNFT